MSLPPTPNSMNFLPEDYVEKREATRAAMVFMGLLLIVVGGIVGAWLFTQWQDKSIFDENEKINAKYEEASKESTEVQELNQEKDRMFAKAQITTTLMERVRRSALLEELTRLRPKGVNFVEVDLKTEAAANAPKPLTDIEKAKRQKEGLSLENDDTPHTQVTVDLVGTAPTDFQVSQYIAGLNACPLVTDVNLLFSEEFSRGKEESNKEIMRRFHVEMKINPAADLRGAQVTANDAHLADSQ